MKILKTCTQCNKEYYVYQSNVKKTIQPFCGFNCYGNWQKGKTLDEQGKPERNKKLCSIMDCTAKHFGKGYCKKHYSRFIELPKRRIKKPKKIKSTPKEICCGFCNKMFIVSHKKAKFCSQICSGLQARKPFIIKKGYKKILDYSHHRSDRKGYVFEHIVVMEKHINRPLLKPETVHHIDHNKQNNDINNLMLFKNHKEHMAYHRLHDKKTI